MLQTPSSSLGLTGKVGTGCLVKPESETKTEKSTKMKKHDTLVFYTWLEKENSKSFTRAIARERQIIKSNNLRNRKIRNDNDIVRDSLTVTIK